MFFFIKNIENTTEELAIIVEFVLDGDLGELSVRSIPGFIEIKDLQRLITYFEYHIASIKENICNESYTFVTYGLVFQIQGLPGEVDFQNEGYFSIKCMVNVGIAAQKKSDTYVGGESIVNIQNIQNFISSLQTALVNLSSSK